MQEKARLQTQPASKNHDYVTWWRFTGPLRVCSLNLKLEAWTWSLKLEAWSSNFKLFLLLTRITQRRACHCFFWTLSLRWLNSLKLHTLKWFSRNMKPTLQDARRLKGSLDKADHPPRRWFVFAYFFMAFLTNFCFNYHYTTRRTVESLKVWVLPEFISVHLITFVS